MVKPKVTINKSKARWRVHVTEDKHESILD